MKVESLVGSQVPTFPSGLSLLPLPSMMTNLGLWVVTLTPGLVLPQGEIKVSLMLSPLLTDL